MPKSLAFNSFFIDTFFLVYLLQLQICSFNSFFIDTEIDVFLETVQVMTFNSFFIDTGYGARYGHAERG